MGEWNEEAEKKEESGWGVWVAEGRERALGAGGGGFPRLSSGPDSGNQNLHIVILLPLEVLQDLLFYFDTSTRMLIPNFLPSISCQYSSYLGNI